jgi:tetratricopeptide (TPR) repeat protein
MERQTIDPWQLAQAHQYADALAAYDAEPVTGNGQYAPRIANRATVLLCLCRWQEAFDEFARANDIKSRKTKGSQPYLTKMATAQWLMGRRREAIETLERAVGGVASGQIQYGDLPGGVSQGLLLWYAGVTTLDSAVREHALAYLSRLSDGPRSWSWPGPIALYVLGKMRFEEVLKLLAGTPDIDKIVAVAKVDVLKRRRLCRALFYAAVARRDEGNEAACTSGMRQCLTLENPLLEEEWYLARAEAGASPT